MWSIYSGFVRKIGSQYNHQLSKYISHYILFIISYLPTLQVFVIDTTKLFKVFVEMLLTKDKFH